MCYLLQTPTNLLFPLQIRWSIFFQWRWITEPDHITWSQVAGAYLPHTSSPLPPAAAVSLSAELLPGTSKQAGGWGWMQYFHSLKTSALHSSGSFVPLPEGRVYVWPHSRCMGTVSFPSSGMVISLCYDSVLITWYYHSNEIFCLYFIPFQSVSVYSPSYNHWTSASSGEKAVRTKIRKDYTPAKNWFKNPLWWYFLNAVPDGRLSSKRKTWKIPMSFGRMNVCN